MPRLTIRSGDERWSEDEARRPELRYRPFEKQRIFHESPAKYRLFGGAAGPGKSMALLMEAVGKARSHPGSNCLLLRRTYPELEKSLILLFRRHVPRELYLSYNEAKHLVTWRNGSLTQFGYSRSEHDIYQYQGAEFLFIGVDELTQFTLGQWTFLTSRNRCPVPGTSPSMAGATNPGGIGHTWVKSLWIDRRAPPGFENPEQYNAEEYEYIPALLRDNPVYKDDGNYLRSLQALPARMRLAYLEGDWNIFAGQFFDVFDLRKNVLPAAEMARPCAASWLPRWISIDWGFEHPAAVYWHVQDGSEDTGHTYTYREFIAQRMSPRVLAHEIIERSRGEKIDAVFLGPDAFSQRTDEATIAEQLGSVFAAASGGTIPRPTPADNDRVGGWMLMYQLLESGQWVISDACKELIETLPSLVRDERNVEDIAKCEGDDAAEAARYGLKSRLRQRVPPLETRLVERMQQVKTVDPTMRAMQARRIESEERQRGRPVFLRPWWRRH
ncbi:MAG TPA: terminase family protein [Candidatus Acidoferrales bacterium]|nr:terminase family protein [Candidatus Acidoferrales bacterium]